ncbi:MAG: SDR family oxidoreductase [Chitinophagales bacterium]|nr:SDR family oxidoreductase [Chitinophagales bacterium]
MNIVITGASKGIGKALALKFVKEGYPVAVCSRNQEHLNELDKELKEINPKVETILQTADVSKKEDLKNFAETILSHWKTVDILINNAGVFIPGAIMDEDEDNLQRTIETNLYSAYRMTKYLLPTMLKKKSGHIFNMCSIASFQAYPNGGSYAISKFGLLGFSKCLREELKPHNIKVTAVMPGATYTDSWKGVDIREDRFIPVEDVVNMIYTATLLSDRSVVEDIIIRPQLGDIA